MGAEKIATAEDGERPLKFQDTDAAEAFSTSTAAATDSHIVMSTSNRLLIAGSIGVVIFMGALDSSIIATVNPTLIAEFNSGQDIGWYGSVFLLVVGATMPFFGKLITTFQPKIVFLASLAVLEAGCLICALAQNSPTFIVGRAFAGLGCAGVLSGGLTITALISPLQHRLVYTSVVGGFEGVATIVGPTIGGTITNSIGWRWAFWMNVPVGCLLFVILVFFFHPPSQLSSSEQPERTTREKFLQLDLLGGLAIMGCLVCLLLPLQWGGSVYPWGDGRIVVMFVVFGVSFILIAVYESRKGDSAVFPIRLLKSKAFVASLMFGFCISSSMWIVIYYLPIWFQAVQRLPAKESGIRMLPISISDIIITTLAAIGTSFVGYLPPFVITSTVLSSLGTGFLYTIYPTIPHLHLIGYQILAGAGLGIGIQQSIVNAQASVEIADVGYGTTAVLLGNIIGGSVFIGVGQAIYLNEVLKLAEKFPGLDKKTLVDDFQSLSELLSPKDLEFALEGYNLGLRKVFLVALVLCSASAFTWPFIPWKSIKTKNEKAEYSAITQEVPLEERLGIEESETR